MPKVSVIMPVYNGERYLADAIGSVLSQTWQDWELIAINDGSTDRTQCILEMFNDKRIIIVQQQNQGAAAARNAGLEKATGDYIAFLDADDLYLQNAFADCVAHLDGHPSVDAIFGDGYIIDSSQQALMNVAEVRPGIYTGYILEHEILNPHVVSFPVCTMTRRAVIEHHGLRFDTGLSPSEDWDFWIQLARYAQFDHLQKNICMYRVHATNTTKTTDRERRRYDLVQGRMKILESDWFDTLSVGTRRAFLHNFLMGPLTGNIAQQRLVLHSAAFLHLPASDQAALLRLMASEYILEGKELIFADHCLQQSLVIWPSNRKAQVLLSLRRLHTPTCRRVLFVWRGLTEAAKEVSLIGRPKPKSLPSGL